MRTLLVEDDAALRRVLKRILISRGLEVDAYADAESAWEAYQREPYPLVLLDWVLPGMDGLELCRKIRSGPAGDRSLILVATSREAPEDLEAVLDAGADDYIAKPVKSRLLEVRLAISQRRALDRQRRWDAEDGKNCNVFRSSRNPIRCIPFGKGGRVSAGYGELFCLGRSA